MKGKGILIADDYDLKVTVRRDSEGKISSGFMVGNTLYQNQALILILQPGELKLSPLVGVGLENSLLDTNKLRWEEQIRRQMELDGQKVSNVKIGKDNKLTLDASYG